MNRNPQLGYKLLGIDPKEEIDPHIEAIKADIYGRVAQYETYCEFAESDGIDMDRSDILTALLEYEAELGHIEAALGDAADNLKERAWTKQETINILRDQQVEINLHLDAYYIEGLHYIEEEEENVEIDEEWLTEEAKQLL